MKSTKTKDRPRDVCVVCLASAKSLLFPLEFRVFWHFLIQSLVPLLFSQRNLRFNGGGSLIFPNIFVDLPH